MKRKALGKGLAALLPETALLHKSLFLCRPDTMRPWRRATTRSDTVFVIGPIITEHWWHEDD